MRRQDRSFSHPSAGVLEEHFDEDSRFTSTWVPGNTESMSVLWNVLSCRAASFPIFRSTLACLVHDLSLQTPSSPLFPLASSHRPVLSRTAAFRFDYLPGNDTYFLNQWYWTRDSRPLEMYEYVCRCDGFLKISERMHFGIDMIFDISSDKIKRLKKKNFPCSCNRHLNNSKNRMERIAALKMNG